MEVYPIRNDEDLARALDEISDLMDCDPERGTEASDRLDIMVTLVEAYENVHHPIDQPDPIDYLKYHMEIGGLTEQDLVPALGSAHTVHDVLSGKRQLSLKMMRRLHQQFNVPVEVLARAVVS